MSDLSEKVPIKPIFKVTDQEILASIPMNDRNLYQVQTVITKKAFIEAYKKWIKTKRFPLYFVFDHEVYGTFEEEPKYESFNNEEAFYKAYDEFVQRSTLIGSFSHIDVVQRVCDELNARRILEEWYEWLKWKGSKGIYGCYEGIPIRPRAIIPNLNINMAKDLCQELLNERYSFNASCKNYIYTIKLEERDKCK